LKTNLEADDVNIFESSDFAFHYQIASIPDNPIYTAAYDAVAGWLTEQRRISTRIHEAMRAAKTAHTRIFKAIVARNANAAAEAMEHHLLEVQGFYDRALDLVTVSAIGDREP
jgi:DNA-binding FadR family transcriptional regulator